MCDGGRNALFGAVWPEVKRRTLLNKAEPLSKKIALAKSRSGSQAMQRELE